MTRKIISVTIVVFLLFCLITGDVLAGQKAKDKKKSSTLDLLLYSNGEGSGDHEWWLEAMKMYEAMYPDVEVILNLGPSEPEKLRPRLLSNDSPDLTYTPYGELLFLAINDMALDITNFTKTAKAIGFDGLVMDNLAIDTSVEINGKKYGVPYYFWSMGIFYNKTMAKQYGWEVPTDWEAFLKLAPRIREKGIYPLTTTLTAGDSVYLFHTLFFTSLLVNYGKEYLKPIINLEKGAWKRDGVITLIDRLISIYKQGYLPEEVLNIDWMSAQLDFFSGKAFMIPNGSWLELEMGEDVPEDFEIGFIPGFMHDKGKKPGYIAFTEQLWIPADAKNPENAQNFLRVIYSRKMQEKLAAQGMLPIVKETFPKYEKLSTFNDIEAQIKAGKANFITAYGGDYDIYESMTDTLYSNFQALIAGKIGHDAFLDILEAKAGEILNDNSIEKFFVD